MRPLRNNSRINYDPELPKNWILKKRREELTVRNISFPSNLRRMGLVRLLRRSITQHSSVGTAESTKHALPISQSHNASDNKNGHDQ